MLGDARPVGQHISNLFSDFDTRSYGHSKLSDLVRKQGAFDVEKIDGSQRASGQAHNRQHESEITFRGRT